MNTAMAVLEDISLEEYEARAGALMLRIGDAPEEVEVFRQARAEWCEVMNRRGSLREQLAVWEKHYGHREPLTDKAQLEWV